jgi:hypothetical protein
MSLADPFAPIKIVIITPGVRDEALAEDMDLAAYERTRDPGLVKANAGALPKWVRLAPLKRTFVAEVIDSFRSESQRYAMAFLAACRGIENVDGATLEPATEKGAYEQRVAQPDFVDAAADVLGMRGVYEAGKVALQRAYLPKGRSGPFAL